MGFILKKIISTILMPLPLAVIFILVALFFLYRKQFLKAKIIVIFSLFWLFIFSYDPVANRLLYQIESSYPTLHNAPKETRYIYLLGGGHSDDESLPVTSQVSNEAVVRLSEAIRLYRQLEGKAKIIVSGYSGPNNNTSHAVMQNKLAKSLGIPQKDIIVSPEPQDTEDEAINAKHLIGDKTFILVTSAYHMKRAMQWFEKQNLHPSPAPTYHQSTKINQNFSEFFSPIALIKSRVVFHEVLGLLWQKIKG